MRSQNAREITIGFEFCPDRIRDSVLRKKLRTKMQPTFRTRKPGTLNFREISKTRFHQTKITPFVHTPPSARQEGRARIGVSAEKLKVFTQPVTTHETHRRDKNQTKARRQNSLGAYLSRRFSIRERELRWHNSRILSASPRAIAV